MTPRDRHSFLRYTDLRNESLALYNNESELFLGDSEVVHLIPIMKSSGGIVSHLALRQPDPDDVKEPEKLSPTFSTRWVQHGGGTVSVVISSGPVRVEDQSIFNYLIDDLPERYRAATVRKGLALARERSNLAWVSNTEELHLIGYPENGTPGFDFQGGAIACVTFSDLRTDAINFSDSLDALLRAHSLNRDEVTVPEQVPVDSLPCTSKGIPRSGELEKEPLSRHRRRESGTERGVSFSGAGE